MKVNVGGRDCDVKFNKKMAGASFLLPCSGDGKIEIGTELGLKSAAANMLHEVTEVLLTDGAYRHTPSLSWLDNINGDCTRFLFVLNHDQFQEMIPKILQAMLDSGIIKLGKISPEKRRIKTKKKPKKTNKRKE